MFENKFFLLFINFLWMAGLFGTLFTLVYMAQYRRKHWWNIGYTYNVPRLLAPLYAFLLCFALGLALHAYATQQTISLWVALVWVVLACFFLFRAIDVILAALQSGWDSVIDGPQADEVQAPRWPLWSVSVSGLLLANLLLLGWWGSVQLNAGTLTLPWTARGRTENSNAPVSIQQRSLIKPVAQTQWPTPTDAITPTINLVANITATLVPAVSTLAADELQVTPTPVEESAITVAPPVSGTTALSLTVTPPAPSIKQIILEPTATAPPTPTPQPTLTPTPTVGPVLTVQSATGANVHTAPDLAAPVIALLPNGATPVVLGRTAANQWFSIELPDGAQGWIAHEVVTMTGSPDLLPILKP